MSEDETKRFDSAQRSKKWHLLVEAAKRALEEQGYSMERVPGRGLSNIWKVSKGGKTQVASIRTTQDRWFAFPPLNDGTKWKTLDDADIVVVAAVDDRDDPTAVETFQIFDRPRRSRKTRLGGTRLLNGASPWARSVEYLEGFEGRKNSGRFNKNHARQMVCISATERWH